MFLFCDFVYFFFSDLFFALVFGSFFLHNFSLVRWCYWGPTQALWSTFHLHGFSSQTLLFCHYGGEVFLAQKVLILLSSLSISAQMFYLCWCSAYCLLFTLSRVFGLFKSHCLHVNTRYTRCFFYKKHKKHEAEITGPVDC